MKTSYFSCAGLIKICFFGLIILSVFSCAKLETAEEIQQDPNRLFITRIHSDSAKDYYVSGVFNGRYLCFSTSQSDYMNAWYVYTQSGDDAMHLIRTNSNGSAMIAFYFTKPSVFSRRLPYVLPRDAALYGEFVELNLINMNHDMSITQGSDQDNFTFKATSFFNTVKTEITSVNDSVVAGSFSGRLSTMTGSIITVEDGKFRIRVKKINI